MLMLMENLEMYTLLILIILTSSNGSESCMEEERLALLDIKAYLSKLNFVKKDLLLPSWISDPATDCCSWERVKCNSTTTRVEELSLHDTALLTGPVSDKYWLLNATLFLSFQELRYLDLSKNLFSGCQKDHGFQKLSNLKKLDVLDLGSNNFDNSILSSLSALPSLRTLNFTDNNRLGGSLSAKELAALNNLETLDLSWNGYEGHLPLQGLSRLEKLETLNLSGNRFNNSVLKSLVGLTSLKNLDLSYNLMEGTLPNNIAKMKNLEKLDLSYNRFNGSLTELATLKNLEILDLSGNELSGHISPSIGRMASLVALSLANNNLSGSLPTQGLCELKNLRELDISRNNLTGVIPPCLGGLTNLRVLDLSFNRLEGNISSIQIPSLLSLEYIDISRNLFEGSFSFSSISNHTNLKVLILGCDGNKLQVETEYDSSWIPKFQLTILAIPNCNLIKLPEFLFHQFDLRLVDLSSNNITGIFPNWLLEKNINLEFLNLRNNSFASQFYLSPNSSSKISRMDISDNHFYGQLQENIGEMLPRAFYINVSENALEGSISPSVCSIRSITILDLSSNYFSGEVSDKTAENCSALLFLSLANNKFRGQIPNLNASALRFLYLSDNQFSGILPHGITQLSMLVAMDISSNQISGDIESYFWNKTLLPFSLMMRENALEGKISCDQLASHVYLDLSYNYLSGLLPSCEFSQVSHLSLEGNKITGSIPAKLFNSSSLLTLNLKSNFLSGKIPMSVVAYSDLRVLLLGGNFLSGVIPEPLCQFKELGILDLSQNFLSGSIPHCFSNITFGNIERNDTTFFVASINIPLPGLLRYDYESLLQLEITHDNSRLASTIQVSVEFVTKARVNTYKGSIIDLLSGLDLSNNRLTGEIPSELGNLSWTHGLNLSHNQLTGSIPSTLSNLRQVESLDLSYNNLSGEIPSALIDLNFLEVFSVAHNNLSGRVPDAKAQFGTFENSSYEGNPFLCGPPLERSCGVTVDKSKAIPNLDGEKWYEIDDVVFTASFVCAYLMFFAAGVVVLYINPIWQQRCCYFVSDTFHKLSAKFYNK